MRRAHFGPWTVDLGTGVARRDERTERLSTTERNLLAYLAASPDQTVTRRKLLIDVWGYHPASRSRAVDTTVARLRGKLEDDPDDPRVLITVHGEGYRFVAPVEPHASVPDEGAEAEAPASHLPIRTDRFFGRVDELARLHRLVDDGERLIEIAGPGGMGKTRLAERFAAERGDHDGAIFVDAADARDEGDLLRAVALVLDVVVTTEAADTVGHALAHRGRVLLVLDNLEQVAGPAASVVRRLHATASRATLLLTTRVSVALPGLVTVHLDPLSRADAKALFHDRAYGCDPDDPDAARLIDALDRWPLALELAASRTRAMTPARILERLRSHRSVLADRRLGVRPERHTTLDAAIEGTLELLAEAERRALGRLSVFEDGFTVDAAEAVLALPDDVLVDDVLQTLVEHSVLRFDPSRDRLAMLVPIQERARRLLEPGEHDDARRAHVRWFAELADFPDLDAVPGPVVWSTVQRLTEERSNLRAARVAATALGLHVEAARCALALAEVFRLVGPPEDALVHLVAVESGDRDLHARAVVTRVGILGDIGAFDEGRRLIRGLIEGLPPDSPHRGRALRVESIIHMVQGDQDVALRDMQSSIEAERASGRDASRALSMVHLANYHARLGRLDVAEADLKRALTIAASARAERVVQRVAYSLALLEQRCGDLAAAEQAIERMRASWLALGEPPQGGGMLDNARGRLLIEQGRLDEAASALASAIDAYRRIGRVVFTVAIHLELARVLIERDRIDEATGHLEALQDAAARLASPLVPCVLHAERALIACLGGDQGAALVELRGAAALLDSVGNDDVVARVLAISARVYAAGGDREAAQHALRRLDELFADRYRPRLVATQIEAARRALDSGLGHRPA